MKIVHCCLGNFYFDNYGYQENILPRIHKKLGHDVLIIASTENIDENKRIVYVNPQNYLNEDGLSVHRIAYHSFVPKKLKPKLRLYENLLSELKSFSPDIIFLHGVQTLAARQIIKYMKENKNVRLYTDCHADYNNSAKNFLSKYILHKIVYKYCARIMLPYVRYYYGVLPARCKFLNEVYGIPYEKIKLLLMGVDDEIVYEVKNNGSYEIIRSRHGKTDTFFIVTGGKFNTSKRELLILMDSVNKIKEYKIKLIIFGSISDELKDEFDKHMSDNISYVGWLNVKETYSYLNAADLVIFPGLHSVLWEEAVGLGIPGIFRKIQNTDHIKSGENSILLETISVQTLVSAIRNCIDKYAIMKDAAQKCSDKYSYYQIAKYAIEEK